MIHPDQRSTLTDALTPPPGFRFESGFATTYSLDLVTLLTMPLHLAWMGSSSILLDPIDPLPVLEALRRTSDRLTVLCERGRIHIPRTASPLLGLLEGMVHEVAAPHGGAFHPKVWLLQFIGVDTAASTHLRLLVLSRNLTDDRSWDISVRLEGACGKARKPENRPLLDFVRRTVGLSGKELTPQRRDDVERLLSNLARCSWELPTNFDEMAFHSIGLDRKPNTWLPNPPSTGPWDELGVLSPFIAATALERLADLSRVPLFLVSRPESLDKLSEPTPGGFQKIWVLDDRAEASDEDDDLPGRIAGLHAKVYVGRRGWNTHLFLGSANATDAALVAGHNVEFMVELIGRTSRVGRPVDWQGQQGRLHLLVEYQRGQPPSPELEAQELALKTAHVSIVSSRLELRCIQNEAAWFMDLVGMNDVQLSGATLHVWPITLTEDRSHQVGQLPSAGDLRLGPMAAHEITSFFGFRLKLGTGTLAFTLQLPIQGAPEGRELEILKASLRNREGFVRYLSLLLGEWDPAGVAAGNASGRWAHGWTANAQDDPPIFEMLVRSYSRDPARISQVRQLLDRLSAEDGQLDESIVPPGFSELLHQFELAMPMQEEAK